MSTPILPPTANPQSDSATDGKASFAETALKLGGKSEDEARRTGAIDKADDQVETLFAPRYQTTNSPVHRAVWERGLPVDLFASKRQTPLDVQRVMDDSIDVVTRHRHDGTLLDAAGKVSYPVLGELGTAGYWGLLVDTVWRQRAPFASFAPFLDAHGHGRSDGRRPGLGARLHRSGRSGAHVRQRRAEAALSAPAGQWRAAVARSP